METTDLNREAQSSEAPAIILIRKKICLYICIYMYIYNLRRNKSKILILISLHVIMEVVLHSIYTNKLSALFKEL